MIIGIPREIKEGEKRVALTPAGVRTLTRQGHSVLVERSAGQGSGFKDEEYVQEGAVLAEREDLFRQAELIVKVKEPLEEEWPLLTERHILFTYLHLASSEALALGLLNRGFTGVAYETVQSPRDGRLPLLTPMSEVAGRMAVQVAMRFLETDFGGKGILLGGVPGVPPAEVVILGGGIVGFNAAKAASGLGAHVTILDVDHDRLKYLDEVLQGRITTIFSNPYTIARTVAYADVLIGGVLLAGAKAPVLVTGEMVSTMRPGAVIIDVSVDQGGCVETIRPTSHGDPAYTLHDVIHYGVPNMPGAVPRTSTYALTNATLPYISRIAEKGIKGAAQDDPGLARGINFARGVLTYPAVAEAFGRNWKPWDDVI